MSVAYAYYKYLITVSVWYKYYSTDNPDLMVILKEQKPIHWIKMNDVEKADQSGLQQDTTTEASVPNNRLVHVVVQKEPRDNVCTTWLKSFFIIFGVLGVAEALLLIVAGVLASRETKAYDSEQTSIMVDMVMLAVSGAVTICVIIYGQVAVFTRHLRSIHVAGVVLILLIIVQAIMGKLIPDPADEAQLIKSLEQSFKLAREGQPRHVKIWASTQSQLSCCGVDGPEDYRSSNTTYYLPPDVPISCCVTYVSSRSDLVQERNRELCKVKSNYYTEGCKDEVVSAFTGTLYYVFDVVVGLIIIEVVLIIFGALLRRGKEQKK